MKKVYIKTLSLLALTLVVTSCVKEDDFAIPTIKEVVFSEGFESTTTGSGSNEAAIALPGWANFPVKGSRKWHSRTFSGNKYAEFSSFYSVAPDTNDEIWLVTPAIDLSKTNNELLSFDTKVRIWQGAALTVLISENYDGTQAGLATATWTELEATLPTATSGEVFVSSGAIDVSQYNSANVRVAFKYVGSRTGVTTTYQVDNIKIYEN